MCANTTFSSVGSETIAASGVRGMIAVAGVPDPHIFTMSCAPPKPCSSLTEQAMDSSLKGDPEGAVNRLLEAGEQSLNSRILEMASLIARRHAATLPDAEALVARAAATLKRSCLAMNHIAGIQRSGRSPGGSPRTGRP